MNREKRPPSLKRASADKLSNEAIAVFSPLQRIQQLRLDTVRAFGIRKCAVWVPITPITHNNVAIKNNLKDIEEKETHAQRLTPSRTYLHLSIDPIRRLFLLHPYLSFIFQSTHLVPLPPPTKAAVEREMRGRTNEHMVMKP